MAGKGLSLTGFFLVTLGFPSTMPWVVLTYLPLCHALLPWHQPAKPQVKRVVQKNWATPELPESCPEPCIFVRNLLAKLEHA